MKQNLFKYSIYTTFITQCQYVYPYNETVNQQYKLLRKCLFMIPHVSAQQPSLGITVIQQDDCKTITYYKTKYNYNNKTTEEKYKIVNKNDNVHINRFR
jgi:hypothetical protein